MGCLRAFAAVVLLSSPVSADVIELRSDPWCPYVCDDPARPGFMLELVREALAPYGHDIRFEVLPWSRAIHKAERGEIDGIIAATPEEAPELLFSEPMNSYVDAIAFRRGEMVRVETAEDLRNLRLGAIMDYEYYGAVNEYIDQHQDGFLVQYAVGEMPLETNLRKLLAGRIDVVAETDAVLRHVASEMGILDQLDIYTPEGSGFVHIAFAPGRETSALYVAQLNEGLARLRASGRFAAILQSYGQ